MSDATGPDVSAVVPLDGRGSLVFETLHARPLYLSAVLTLDAAVGHTRVRVEPGDLDRVVAEVAGVGSPATVVTTSEWWAEIRSGPGGPLLVHDPLCPLAPVDLVSSLLERVRGSDTSYAAVRPVTDTVKTAAGGRITGTLDRTDLMVVSSPVAVSSAVMRRAVAADESPPLHDVARLVAWLREHGGLSTLPAPSIARRVDDASSVLLLECVDELNRQLRQARGHQVLSDGPDSRPHEPA